MKSIDVAIVGPPNAGKSTLINSICETNLLPVSSRAQTTFHPLSLIYVNSEMEVCFFDTPGWVQGSSELDQRIRKNIIETIKNVDLVIALSSPPQWLTHGRMEVISARPEKKQVLEIIQKYAENIEQSKYMEDNLSLHPSRLFFLDNVRALLLERFQEEVPYEIALNLRGIQDKKVFLDLIVNRDSQKAILLSKIGLLKKSITSILFRTLGKGHKVVLHVSVEKNWMKNPSKLNEYGYE